MWKITTKKERKQNECKAKDIENIVDVKMRPNKEEIWPTKEWMKNWKNEGTKVKWMNKNVSLQAKAKELFFRQ